MGLLSKLKGPVLGFVLSVVAFVGVALIGLIDLAGTLTQPGVTLLGLLGTVLTYVGGLLFIVLLALVFVGWGLYRLGSTAMEEEVWRDPRLARAVETVEGQSDRLRKLGLSDSVRPTERDRVERRLEQLKADYASGEITRHEYERRVERLLADSDLDGLQFDDPTIDDTTVIDPEDRTAEDARTGGTAGDSFDPEPETEGS
jgi:uncharacterized membrane protein